MNFTESQGGITALCCESGMIATAISLLVLFCAGCATTLPDYQILRRDVSEEAEWDQDHGRLFRYSLVLRDSESIVLGEASKSWLYYDRDEQGNLVETPDQGAESGLQPDSIKLHWLEPGRLLLCSYETLDPFGSGGFGSLVRMVLRRDENGAWSPIFKAAPPNHAYIPEMDCSTVRSCELDYDKASAILTLTITDAVHYGYSAPASRPLERKQPDGTLASDIHTRCIWRYRLRDDGFEFTEGKAELLPGQPDATLEEVHEFVEECEPFNWLDEQETMATKLDSTPFFETPQGKGIADAPQAVKVCPLREPTFVSVAGDPSEEHPIIRFFCPERYS